MVLDKLVIFLKKGFFSFLGKRFDVDGYLIDKDSVITNLKVYLGGNDGKPINENDLNFLVKPPVNQGFITRLLNSNEVISVGAQIKDFSGSVDYSKVHKDEVNAFMTRVLGHSLLSNTVIATERSGNSSLESKLISEFPVKIINRNDLYDYNFRQPIGVNSVGWSFYNESIKVFESAKLEIGMLALLNNKSLSNGLKLVNLIHVDAIDYEEAYDGVKAKLDFMNTYMNLKRYVYLASNGIAPKGENFLSRISIPSMNPKEFYTAICNNNLLSIIPEVEYDLKSINGMAVASKAASELENCIYNSIKNSNDKLLTKKNIKSCILRFVNSH